MTDTIASIADLEACLGPAGLGVKMKQIDFLDDGAKRWMAASPLAFVGSAGTDGLSLTLAGGMPGFMADGASGELVLPVDAVDDTAALAEGKGVGLLLLVPGITETMRINGRIASLGGDLRVAVDEVYIHCGKAIIRSEFWQAQPSEADNQDAASFLGRTRFMALATADSAGRADVSPKGDPAGSMVRWHANQAVFADRPGNRRADGFRNMIDRPEAMALGLAPGSTKVVRVAGKAHLTRDPEACTAFAVDGKIPQIVTQLEGPPPEVRSSAALERARLWPAAAMTQPQLDPSAILVGHIKLNKMKGEQADHLRGIIETEAVREDLKLAYQHTLY